MNNKLLVSVLLAILLVIPITLAIPENITVQGRLTDDSASPLSGSVSMNFSIYTVPTGGSADYSLLDQTVNLDDSGVWYHTLYNVDLAFDSEYYLGVSVNGEAEMSPRIVLTSSPYAYVAKKAEGLAQLNNDLNVTGNINATGQIDASVICLNGDCSNSWPNISLAPQPAFFVHKNAVDQTVSSDAFTTLTWNFKSFDSTSEFNLVNNQFEATKEGYYFFTAAAQLNSIEDQRRGAVYLLKNNNFILSGDLVASAVTGTIRATVNGLIKVNRGDNITVQVWHDGTGDKIVKGTNSATYFTGYRIASGSPWVTNEGNITFTDGNVNITNQLWLGKGKIQFNDTTNTYEFYNGSVWQEIGTGAAGSSGGSQWNITGSSYIINNSGVLDINETKLNASIAARSGSSAASWVNTTQNVTTGLNVSLGSKITFALGAIIKNVVSGWLTITGNTIVEGDFNVTGDIGLNGGNISYDSGRLLVDGTQLGIEDSRVNIVCPTGFTRIENNGYVLGCMQNNEEGTTSCTSAINSCWNNYGGRLPDYNEIFIAFQNYDFGPDETDNAEWTNEGYYDTGSGEHSCGMIHGHFSPMRPSGELHSASADYRCFIPAQSGTPWENVTDGISYSQNVSITGDLSARKLCLNGTCFTQLPNQEGIAPGFGVAKDSTQSISNTYTAVTWQTRIFDTNNDFYIEGENDPLTGCTNCFRPSVPGYYLLTGTVAIDIPTNSRVGSGIYEESTLVATGSYVYSTSGGAERSTVSKVVYANGTNYFQFAGYHSYSSGNRNIQSGSQVTYFTGFRIDSGSPWLLENGNATLDANANITGTLTLGDGKIRYNGTAAAFEFYNGTVWQEIGTGAAGAGSGSQWNIENNYIVNVSDVLSFNETLLNATIDARSSSSGAGWSNTSTTTSTTLNVSLGDKITFALGAIIKNVVSGWMTITGNTIIEGNLNATGDLGLNGGNISYDSGRLLVDGTQLGTEDSRVNIVCPTGFTRIESNGYVLGCMQTDEEGVANCTVATNNCFSKYGGRLPDFGEISIAFNNYVLLNEDDDAYELTGEMAGYYNGGGFGSCGTIKANGEPYFSNTWVNNAYRCFIPAQSGTPWENVTDGISYSQNVTVTGDLSARKLCLNGTCFTQLPSQDGINSIARVTLGSDVVGWTSGSLAKVNFNVETIDINSDFAAGTFTVAVAGYYHVAISVDFSDSADGGNSCQSNIYVNGANIKAGVRNEQDATICRSMVSDVFKLEIGDTVEAYAWHNMGTGVNLKGTNNTVFDIFRIDSGSPWLLENGNATLDADANITGTLTLGGGKIRYNGTAAAFEFYNGTVWQEIGTGASGGSGSQWNIENNYIINSSDVLSFNETLLNATIDARTSASAGIWDNVSGTATFNGDANVTGDLALAGGNVSYSGGDLRVDGKVVGYQNSNVNLVCPTGFTKIENNGYVLGCMQNDEEGTASCNNAIDNCWKNYGATLPSYNEIFIAINTSKINDAGSSLWEWTDVGSYYNDGTSGHATCGLIRTDTQVPTGDDYNDASSYDYRCFIPAQSGTPWENVTDGISYSQNVTVTGDLSARKLCLNGTCFTSLPSQESISPTFLATKTSLQSIAHGATPEITWDTTNFDTNSDFYTNSENDPLTSCNNCFRPSVPGYYLLTATISLSNVLSGQYAWAKINKDGSSVAFSTQIMTGAAGAHRLTVSTIQYANGTNYFDMQAYQYTGSNVNIQLGEEYTRFSGARLDSGSPWLLENGNATLDANANITGTLTLGDGKIRYNNSAAAFEFYNGTTWQEIGTGAAGSGSGDGAGWSNTSTTTSTGLNLSIGARITFALGGIIENIASEFMSITGNLIVDGNLNVTGNITTDKYVNFNGTDGTNGFGIREENGKMQYKDSDGVWKSFSTQTPTGNVVWTKIWEYDVEGSAEDEIVITGLNGDSDISYQISGSINSAVASSKYGMRFNGDSATNYGHEILHSNNGVTGGGADTAIDYVHLSYSDGTNKIAGFSGILNSQSGMNRVWTGNQVRSVSGTIVGYTVKVDAVWNNAVSNIENITFMSDKSNAFGIGTHLELWAPRPVEVSNVNVACPTGFTKIENNGYVLGCMQNDEANGGATMTCPNAIDHCFDTYGARLPGYDEAYIAFNNYVLQNEGLEWTGEAAYDNGGAGCGFIDGSFNPTMGAIGGSQDFRCFIPAQGASSWVNGSAGLGYEGDVNITGKLRLGEGEIQFNTTSKNYEFYNGTTWQEIGTGSGGSADGTGGWTNTTTETSTTLDVKVGDKITFAFGEMIDNMVDGWLTMAGSLNIMGNVVLQENGYVNFNQTSGTNGYGIRDNNGDIQYKDSDGVWKSLSKQSPTGNVVWTKIWEYDVESPTNEIVIEGLDGNSDGQYKLSSTFVAAGASTFQARPNQISSGYGENILYSSGTANANTATSYNGVYLGNSDASGKKVSAEILIQARNGTGRTVYTQYTHSITGTTVATYGTGIYELNNVVDNIENISIVAASGSAHIGTGSHFELWAPRPVEVSNVNIVCPTGFTKIQNNGYVLGCMQNNEENSGTCEAATNDCFINYGGRLPTYSEAYIAFSNYELTNEGSEWVGSIYVNGATNSCGYIDSQANSFRPTGGLYSQSFTYRCFIPAQGASSWVNGSAGLGYDGDINVTGQLTLGEGKIQFNDTTKSYEFYNGSEWQEIGTGAAGSGSGDGAGWSNTSTTTSTGLNLSIGDRITFALGGIIENIASGFVSITGNLIVDGNLNVTGNITTSEYVNFNGTKGTNGYGIRDNNGDIQYKDADGVWKSLSTQTPTGNVVWTKIYEYDVPSNTQSFVIKGLDGDSDEVYRIIYRGSTPAATTHSVLLRFNGDSGSNYIQQYVSGTSSTASAGRLSSASGMIAGYLTGANDETFGEITLMAKSGKTRLAHNLITGGVVSASSIEGHYTYSTGWKNTADNIENITVYTSQAGGIKAGSHIEIWAPRPVEVSNVNIVCPSGFFKLENNGYVLGCMQATRELESDDGTQSCQTAMNDCFTTYGGRLPSYSEIYSAVQNHASAMTDEGTEEEWIDVGHFYDSSGGTPSCGIIHTSVNNYQPNARPYTENADTGYRCFIPAQGASSWVNGSAGLGYEGDVNITGTLKLGEGSIRFNSTNAAYEFYNGSEWQEIGTGAAGSGSGDGAGWSNTSSVTSTNLNVQVTGNITPGANNTYTLGTPDNVWKEVYVGNNSLWIGNKKISNDGGSLVWDGMDVNLNGTNISVDQYVSFNGTEGANGFGFREENGKMQYKDADGVWKSLSTQTPTGNVVWTKIWEYDVESNVASIPITGLDGNADGNYQLTGTIVGVATDVFFLQFNDDSANNYGWNYLYSDKTTAQAYQSAASAGIYLGDTKSGNNVGMTSDIFARNGTERTVITSVAGEVSGITLDDNFELKQSWNNKVSNIQNMTIVTNSAGSTIGKGSHFELWAPRPVEVSNVNIVCPTGFTKIQSNGYVLGCMQNGLEPTNNWYSAVSNCHNTYGGRLPSHSETITAINNYALQSESTWIWTDDIAYSSNWLCTATRNGNEMGSYLCTDSSQYRCFIPAQGASSWVNGSAGLGYEGDVNITGTLKLGDGSIRFNSTSAAYEFYNGTTWQAIGTGTDGSADGTGNWTESATETSTSLNLSIGDKITFALGSIIENIASGFVSITGNLIVNGDLNVTGNISTDSYVNFNGTSGSDGYGIRDNYGDIQYKDADGVWKSFSTKTPTGNVVWTKIWEYDVEGSAEQSVIITGLDADADYNYKFIAQFKNDHTAQTRYMLHLNGDSSSANYERNYHYYSTNSDAIINAADTGIYTGIANQNYGSNTEVLLYGKSGNYRAAHTKLMRDVSSGGLTHTYDVSTVWKNTAANIENITVYSEEVNGLGVGTHMELWAPRPVEVSNVNIVCPTGFTKIQNNGYVLGCMQNDLANSGSTDNCNNAISDCFNTYGGRLPSYNEYHISFSNYVLSSENTNGQWTGESTYDTGGETYSCGIFAYSGGNLPSGALHTESWNYRCFIPAQGASNWETNSTRMNTSMEIIVDNNLNVTGTVYTQEVNFSKTSSLKHSNGNLILRLG